MGISKGCSNVAMVFRWGSARAESTLNRESYLAIRGFRWKTQIFQDTYLYFATEDFRLKKIRDRFFVQKQQLLIMSEKKTFLI